jgi:hypothetical protein
MGDFNYPGLNWNSFEADQVATPFLEWMLIKGLTQHVLFPTRGNNILDLLLTNEPEMVQKCEPYGTLGDSDHIMIRAEVCIETERAINEPEVLDFKKMKLKKLKTIFRNTNWEELLVGSTEECWDKFMRAYNQAVLECIPRRKRIKRNPPWMKRIVKQAVKEKKQLWRKYRRTGKELDYNKFVDKSNQTKSQISAAKHSYEEKLARNIKEDSKSFFAYIRQKQKTRTVVGPLQKENGDTIVDNEEEANLLNDYFSSVFTLEDNTQNRNLSRCSGGPKRRY